MEPRAEPEKDGAVGNLNAKVLRKSPGTSARHAASEEAMFANLVQRWFFAGLTHRRWIGDGGIYRL